MCIIYPYIFISQILPTLGLSLKPRSTLIPPTYKITLAFPRALQNLSPLSNHIMRMIIMILYNTHISNRTFFVIIIHMPSASPGLITYLGGSSLQVYIQMDLYTINVKFNFPLDFGYIWCYRPNDFPIYLDLSMTCPGLREDCVSRQN